MEWHIVKFEKRTKGVTRKRLALTRCNRHYRTSASYFERKPVCILHDRQSKFIRAMPNSKTLPSHVANVLFDSWVVPFFYLRSNELWSTIYENAVRNDMHHTCRELSKNNCLQLSNELAGRTVQSYDSHTTTALSCQEPEGLGTIRATFFVRVQRAGSQFHNYDSVQSCFIAAPTWTNTGFPTERASLWQLYRHWSTLAEVEPPAFDSCATSLSQFKVEKTRRVVQTGLRRQDTRRSRAWTQPMGVYRRMDIDWQDQHSGWNDWS